MSNNSINLNWNCKPNTSLKKIIEVIADIKNDQIKILMKKEKNKIVHGILSLFHIKQEKYIHLIKN